MPNLRKEASTSAGPASQRISAQADHLDMPAGPRVCNGFVQIGDWLRPLPKRRFSLIRIGKSP